jgi:5-methylcytosine-specific restriction endonuclease McrA
MYPEKVKATKAAVKAANPQKVKDRDALYAERNKERRRANYAAYYSREKEKILERNKDWRLKNPEKARLAAELWILQNPTAKRRYFENRRARIRMSPGTLSKNVVVKLMTLQKGLCACCRLPLGDDYHLDHIMPLALGGGNIDSNVQLLRQECNRRKSAKHPVDYMQERGYLL